ncbi:MAG: RedB protein [Planctomycetes bacterium]|nr:RedB protein [Planctomycetota bacterium]
MTPLRSLACAAWIALVLALVAASERRDARPGDPGAPAATWPAATSLRPDGTTLVLLVHPRCPCTAASLDALEDVLRAARGPVRAYVLVVVPAGAPVGFEEAAALDRARAIGGAVAVVDPDAREATRFGARTSGALLAYDAAGRLRFAGGLTPGRGRRGDTPARAALLSLIADKTGSDRPTAPVFGCPLEDS